MVHAAVDSTIRDTELGDYTSNSKTLFAGDDELEWLRKTRNSLVHVSDNPRNPLVDPAQLDQLGTYHDKLEDRAKRAIRIMFRTVFANPGT